MTTKKTTYEAVKKAADEISAKRVQVFLKELEGQLPSINGVVQWEQLRGKEFSATTIDAYLRRALSQAKLEVGTLNRAAFEFWKVLVEAGAVITHQDVCQIIPDPDIEGTLAREIEKHFTKNKK